MTTNPRCQYCGKAIRSTGEGLWLHLSEYDCIQCGHTAKPTSPAPAQGQGEPPKPISLSEAVYRTGGLSGPSQRQLGERLEHLKPHEPIEPKMTTDEFDGVPATPAPAEAGTCPTCKSFVNSCGHSKMRVYSMPCNDGSGMSQTICGPCQTASNSVTVASSQPSPGSADAHKRCECHDCTMSRLSGLEKAFMHTAPTGDTNEVLDMMVRDFCAVGWNVKSETRRRIKEYGELLCSERLREREDAELAAIRRELVQCDDIKLDQPMSNIVCELQKARERAESERDQAREELRRLLNGNQDLRQRGRL